MSLNPYSAPRSIPAETAALVTPQRGSRPWRALGRWTLICCISAAPSFFWGSALHHQFEHVVAMIGGILVFVVAYTVAECTPYYQQIITRPHIHRTALIGYGTRIMFSVVFPVGLAVDMMTGVVSIAIVQNISLANSVELSEAGAAASALAVFLTTVVQGILLNIMLFGYMVCVYGLLRVVARVRDRIYRTEHASALVMNNVSAPAGPPLSKPTRS
jgi:hypothetical protein